MIDRPGAIPGCGSILRRIVLGISLAGLLTVLGPVALAHAARTIEHAPMHLKLSAARSSDGTIRLKGIVTSPDPRCLSKRAFADGLSRGHYTNIGAALLYPRGTFGPPTVPRFDPASPPGDGWLAPSSFGHSPMVWRLTLPGDTKVTKRGVDGKAYSALVKDAIGVSMGGGVGHVRLKYGTKKKGVKLICGEALDSPEILF